MAMFDIEDSDDVSLEGNKTGDATLLKGRNIKRLAGKNNESGIIPKNEEGLFSRLTSWLANYVVGGVLSGIIVIFIIFYLNNWIPGLK